MTEVSSKFRVGALALVVLLTLCGTASAQIALIDLNTDASGNEFEGGETLRHEFSTMGIVFSAVGASSPCDNAYANDNHPGDFGSPPTLISLCAPPLASDISEDSFGLIRARFDSTVIGVCIGVRPDDPGTSEHYAVMRAYDSADNLVDEQFSRPGVIETLCVSGQRIRSVEFSGAGERYCRFDDLTVTFGAGPGPQVRYLPGGANQPGFGMTQWNTDLEVTNTGAFDMNCIVELLEWDRANSSPSTSSSFVVPAGSTTRVNNALDSLFGFSGAATLRTSCLGGSLHTSARTFNTNPDGTYGQYIPGMAEGQGITPGRTGIMTQLTQSPNNNTSSRTNLGLVSASNFTIVVVVDLYDADGNLVGSRDYKLAPYESIQIPRVFVTVAGTSIDDGYAVVSSRTTEALFFAYASVVDNGSGDGTYVPATLQ